MALAKPQADLRLVAAAFAPYTAPGDRKVTSGGGAARRVGAAGEARTPGRYGFSLVPDVMPTLYHHPLSAGSRFIRLVLAEYGEEATLEERAPWERREELLALNPAGTLPVLVDDNEAVISGAPVIAEYLFETRGVRFGEDSLMPGTPVERAEARRLVAWFSQKMHGEVTDHLVREIVLKRHMPQSQGGGSPDSVAIRAARANIRYHVRYVGYLAARRDWLAGRDLSLADLAAAAEMSCADYLGEVPWQEDDAARDWYARVKSRLSFRPLLADMVRGAPPAAHYADLDF